MAPNRVNAGQSLILPRSTSIASIMEMYTRVSLVNVR